MRYTHYHKKWFPAKATQAAFLLGGIGTGNFSIGSRGQLMDWEIFNRPGKGMVMPYSFFAIRTQEEGQKAQCKMLESKLLPPYTQGLGQLSHAMGGLPRFEDASIAGEYPFCEVILADEGLPVDVSMSAFTPFVPLDAQASGIPCGILKYTIRNRSSKSVDVSVVGSLCNATEFLGYSADREYQLGKNVRNSYFEEGSLKGLFFDNPYSENVIRAQNSMALTTTNCSDVSYTATWPCEGWFDGIQCFWDEFSKNGKLSSLENRITNKSRIDIETYQIGSLCVTRHLPAHETVEIQFIISWFFPFRSRGWYAVDTLTPENAVRNYYATLYEDAKDVARKTVYNLNLLTKQSLDFRNALYSSTLPDSVIGAAANNITVLRSPTCFRIEDGTFLAWEGCAALEGSCTGTCTHVWNYAQTLAFLFPELEKTARLVEFFQETQADGEMVFRTHRVFGLPLWKHLAAADGQPGTIVRAYREWKLTGDYEFLQKLWPQIKLSMNYIIKHWNAQEDGLLKGEQHNTYDIEFFGISSMTNSLFFAALKACVEMANACDESGLAVYYQELWERGSKNMDELLWNGEYYFQSIDDVNAHKYQYGNGCLADQLVGQFMADIAGLGYVLPKEHVQTALRSIYQYNFRTSFEETANVERSFVFNDEKGLLICSFPKGGRPTLPFVYADEVWTGIEYQVAASMFYEGMLEEGLEIVNAVQSRQNGTSRNPWNENECGNHYARSLSSWGLLMGLCGFNCDMQHNMVSFDPKLNQDHFSCFFSTGKAWGIYTQEKSKDQSLERKLTILYGCADTIKLK